MQDTSSFLSAFDLVDQKTGVWFDTWLDPHFDPTEVMTQLYKQINGNYAYVDQTGFYLDPMGALGWGHVSRQKEYAEGMRSIAYSSASELVGHILAEVGGIREVDLIILGPGEADAEAILAQHMAPFFDQFRVFLVEASDTILRRAQKTLTHALGHLSHTSIFGIGGDLLNLWQYIDTISPPAPQRRRVVVALTVLYNLQDELHFIHNNFIKLSKGDLFIFDFWQALAPLSEMKKIADLEPRLAGTHVRVGWDEALDTWHRDLLRRYCRGFEEVHFSYSLSTHSCPIPDSYSVDKMAHIRRKGKEEEDSLVLQRFKRYSMDSFVKTLEREGWLPVHLWPSRKSKNAGLYLFEKVISANEKFTYPKGSTP